MTAGARGATAVGRATDRSDALPSTTGSTTRTPGGTGAHRADHPAPVTA